MQIVFITDLDGTLLGHDDFDFMPIRSALRRFLDSGIKIIIASSKTHSEIEAFCTDLGWHLPFIYENGAGTEHFDSLCKASAGISLRSEAAGIRVRELFALWKRVIPADLRDLCLLLEHMDRSAQEDVLGLSGTDLDRALNRSYSVPFVFRGNAFQFSEIQKRAFAAGLSVQRGGRICNLSGRHNKAVYLPEIRRATIQGTKSSVIIGFGDGENDIEMLKAVDISCVIPRPNGHVLSLGDGVKPTIVPPRVAPWGWHDAAMSALSLISQDKGVSYG